MPIEWIPGPRQFHLHNARMSHVMRVLDDGSLGTLHLGGPLAPGRSYAHLEPPFRGFANRLDEPVRLECPVPSIGDHRPPALTVVGPQGSTVLELRYASHRIVAGKPAIPGLPSTYVERDDEAETLEVTLEDRPSGAEVTLSYTIFRDAPAIARHARISNAGSATLTLACAMSLSLDLPDADWDLLQLSGAWVRERHVRRRALERGSQSVRSGRGASGHEHNPFLALVRQSTSETDGEVFGASLVYSGSFLGEVGVDLYGTARLRLGLDPDTFRWQLVPGASFHTPEAVLVWSDAGLGSMSDAFHVLYRERLARGTWRDRPRPIVLNSWEAAYFDVHEDRLLSIAAAARDLGIELFVLDDGWFGRRDDDTTSLGDWTVDRRKLPNGLEPLARRVEALGMRFGIWMEPEMVSERSELFAAHPDWALGVPGRPRTPSRNQYVLDLSRPEVVDHLFEAVAGVLGSAPIAYLKWDMNRTITEPHGLALPPDRQGELLHRYMLGVYDLYARLVAAFPDVLIESCAGGGGRFDPGMLAYAPQTWTSDDTDAIERLAIQWGTSMCYPLSSISAHVSAVPNHQTGRLTPLATRAAVAYFGVLGYELDPSHLSEDERREIAGQIAFYARHRELFQRGRFVRLTGPFDGDPDEVAWMVVSDDRRRAIAAHYTVLSRPKAGPRRLRLRGLDPGATYTVTPWPARGDAADAAAGGRHGGDELMRSGLLRFSPAWGEPQDRDFAARLYVLEADTGA